MLVSKALLKTLREVPSGAEMPSHIFLLRGGYIKQLASGLYSILPLGKRILQKIENVIRDEMLKVDGQEVDLPLVQPAELWIESGRYGAIGAELLRFKDRTEHPMVLAMTHEEAVTDLARNVVVILVMIAVGYAVGFEFTNGVLGPVLAVGLLLAWGFVFSWVGAFLGLSLSSPETVQAAAFPTIFPLVFASSIFVPVQTMPGWLQAFVKVNPITLVTDSVRALALGEPFDLLPSLGWAALAMGLLLAVFVPLSVRRYRTT